MPRTYSARIYRSYFSNEFGSVDLAYGDGGRAQILPHTVVEWARRNPSVALTIDATPDRCAAPGAGEADPGRAQGEHPREVERHAGGEGGAVKRTATLLAMRLAGLQARLDDLTVRVRAHPTHSPKLFAEIWRVCLAHEKTVRALATMPQACADLARGTHDFLRLPRARVPRGARPLGKLRPPPAQRPACWSGACV